MGDRRWLREFRKGSKRIGEGSPTFGADRRRRDCACLVYNRGSHAAAVLAADVKGYDFAWGLGAAIRLGGLGIRAEFERFELEGDDNIMMLTAGVTFGM
jgi:hypothetical protein